MPTYTKNLNLAMPGYEDSADIAVLNQNTQILDGKAGHWNTAPYPVTAALTEGGVLELTGENLPEEKDGLTVQFVSTAASAEGLQMQFAGEDTQYPILTTGEDKAPIQAGAFGEGVPVTLTISGGKAFFKLGGAGINDNLPAQVTAFKAIDSSSGGVPKVNISWTNPSEYFAGILIVKKAGSAPTGVRDGEKVYDGTGTSFADTAVAFGTTYYYRAYPYNEKKQYQTLKNTVSVVPKNGVLLGSLPEGSIIKLTEDNTGTLFYISKHNYESGLNGMGRSLIVRKDCYIKQYWDLSNNKWKESEAITLLNGSYKSLLRPSIQSKLGVAKYKYSEYTNVFTASDSIFLLSMTELGFSSSSFNVEGSKLLISENLKVATYQGIPVEQWTRTPANTGTVDVYYVTSSGNDNRNNYGRSYGIRPVFTLPSDFLLNPIPNSDGSYSPMEE